MDFRWRSGFVPIGILVMFHIRFLLAQVRAHIEMLDGSKAVLAFAVVLTVIPIVLAGWLVIRKRSVLATCVCVLALVGSIPALELAASRIISFQFDRAAVDPYGGTLVGRTAGIEHMTGTLSNDWVDAGFDCTGVRPVFSRGVVRMTVVHEAYSAELFRRYLVERWRSDALRWPRDYRLFKRGARLFVEALNHHDRTSIIDLTNHAAATVITLGCGSDCADIRHRVGKTLIFSLPASTSDLRWPICTEWL